MEKKESKTPSKFFSKLFSSASTALTNAAKALSTPLPHPRSAQPAASPEQHPQQIAVVSSAPSPPEPKKPEEPLSPTFKARESRHSSTTSSPLKRERSTDNLAFKESTAGQELLLRYQVGWSQCHTNTAACAAGAAATHTSLVAVAACTRGVETKLAAAHVELSKMPDMMAELARTAELAATLGSSLAACEEALDALALARVEQGLAAIKAREDKRLQSYGNIRRMEATRAIQRLHAAHARKQQQLAVQASVEAAERQRQYSELFAQQMKHFREHRKLLVPEAMDARVEQQAHSSLSLETMGPDLSQDDLMAFLEDTEQQMAAAQAEAEASDSEGEGGAGAGAGLVRREEEDIDSHVAARMAAASVSSEQD